MPNYIEPFNVFVVGPRNRTVVQEYVLTAPWDGINIFNVGLALPPNTELKLKLSPTLTPTGPGPLLSVYGSMEDSSVVLPTEMHWNYVKGDTATGTNVILQTVTADQNIIVEGGLPLCNNYQARVSSGTTGLTTDTYYLRAMISIL